MLEVLGRRELASELAALKDKPGDQVLHIDLTGRNPDDGVTSIAYDKGAAFVRMIEAAVGRPRFDAWLRGYFDRHAFTSLTTAEFLEDLRAHLIAGDAALERSLQLDAWLEKPGLPANATVPTSTRSGRRASQVARFTAGDTGRQPRDESLDDPGVAALPRVAAGRAVGGPAGRPRPGASASARAATARCCLPGCELPSGTATSRRCRRWSGS